MGLASEFRDFITKGNVIDLAVAVVMGVAFNSVVTAFVSDIITPLIGVAGHYDFSALNYTINGSAFQIGLLHKPAHKLHNNGLGGLLPGSEAGAQAL